MVGAGLVGMAFALGAAQANLRVALIGAAPSDAPSPVESDPWDRRVYAISPTSRRFLERLRVWPHLDHQRVAAVHDMRVYASASARKGLHFSAYEAATDALAWIVEHRELARALSAAIAYQHAVTRISADATGFHIEAEGVQVEGAGHQSARAALLVGADGAASPVRTAAGIQTQTRSYGQTGVVANFACERAHGGTAYQWFTDEGVIALLPLPGKACSLVWSAPDDLASVLLAESAENLARRVEAVAGTLAGRLTPLGGSQGFPLKVMSASSLSVARVALIGDAAHVVHPLAGQGLNLGFDDAAALLEILGQREAFRDCGDPVLMRRYERVRAAPVLEMRTVTDGLQRLFSIDVPLVRNLRNYGLNLVQAAPVLKRILMRHAMGRAVGRE